MWQYDAYRLHLCQNYASIMTNRGLFGCLIWSHFLDSSFSLFLLFDQQIHRSRRRQDCGIFTAPLARGRWLHLWVDMESDNPDAFLRCRKTLQNKFHLFSPFSFFSRVLGMREVNSQLPYMDSFPSIWGQQWQLWGHKHNKPSTGWLGDPLDFIC